MSFDLRQHADRPALLTADGVVTYAELADRADALSATWGTERRLVLLQGPRSVDVVVALVAAWQGGHPVMLAGSDAHADALIQTYAPDIVIRPDHASPPLSGGSATAKSEMRLLTHRPHSADAEIRLLSHRPGVGRELHPELALLMSTSGSTGSPKLVRLSRGAVRANAAAIATYLNLTPADRGLLSLPPHHCYGLSILMSHLYAGAAVVVTDHSVLDSCLWDLAAQHSVTGFAGVPYTFEQLAQTGFPDLPSLRYVTQAGGKLSPERVREHVHLGQRRGWDFYVMYGQTEATARMAYLPPTLAEAHPDAVGIAVPGGRLRIDSPDSRGVGEIVYTGPSVMMGYATERADLARGHDLAELRTGDLGREIAPDVFGVVGRRSRFAKLFGLRIDLDDVERQIDCAVIELDAGLGVVSPDADAARAVAARCGVPISAVRHRVAEIPRTASGKVDRARVVEMVGLDTPLCGYSTTAGDDLCALYRRLLGRDDVTPDDSFVSLGADSLSYVELSLRLGAVLDPLPADWHRRSIAELTELRGSRRRRWVRLDPTVLLRALAIVAIVGTHANLLTIMGGAHALLAICGYNAARFLPGHGAAGSLARAARAVAVPSMIWIGAMCLWGLYPPTSALFLNGLLGSDTWTDAWQFWFLEAAIWTLLALAAVFAIPGVGHLDAKHPFGAALVFLAAAATLRYALVGVEAGPIERYSIPVVLWCFALGWAAARATSNPQRWFVTASAAALTLGFFGDLQRELIIVGAITVVVWAKPIPVPRVVAALSATLAGASLSIYLTHWRIYPHLEDHFPLAATVSSLLVGIAYHRLYGRVALHVNRRVQRRTDEHRDAQDVQPQQHRDRRRERAVDGRATLLHGTARRTEDGAHAVAAHDPHEQRERGSGHTGKPRLPDRHRQVVQRGHEADAQDEHRRPVATA